MFYDYMMGMHALRWVFWGSVIEPCRFLTITSNMIVRRQRSPCSGDAPSKSDPPPKGHIYWTRPATGSRGEI